jgi:hypothetical protein
MGRTGWESALVVFFGVAFATPAHAQAQSLPPSQVATLLSSTTLPHVPGLRLTWPIAPLKFSFSEVEITGYANGPLQLFRAESLWLQTPTFQLLSATSAERAFELDCRVTCQPIVKRVFDLEARMPLPNLGPSVTDTHAFVRSSSFYTSQSTAFTRQLGAGIAGALNF